MTPMAHPDNKLSDADKKSTCTTQSDLSYVRKCTMTFTCMRVWLRTFSMLRDRRRRESSMRRSVPGGGRNGTNVSGANGHQFALCLAVLTLFPSAAWKDRQSCLSDCQSIGIDPDHCREFTMLPDP
jgi:hypothetical protein